MTTSAQAAAEPLVGRSAELRRIADLLDSRSGGLVAVTGPKASGKSAIVAAAADLARARGYTTLTAPDGRGLPLRSRSSLIGFAADLSAAAGAAQIPPPTSGDVVEERLLARALADWITREAGARPVALAVDPYRPPLAVQRALQRHFFPALTRSASPVIVILAARRVLDAELRPVLSLHAERPTPTAVRAYLLRRLAGGPPSLPPEELEVYVEGGVQDPSVLESLIAVLPLGESRAPSASEAAGP